MRCPILTVFLLGCGARLMGEAQGDDPPPFGLDPDAASAPDGVDVDAFVLGPWGTPQPFSIANSGVNEDDGTMSWNGREVIFARQDDAQKHLYITRFDGVAWSAPVKAPFSSAEGDVRDETPRYAMDDRTLYFASTRAPTTGGSDIWMVTRADFDAPWGTPTRVTALSSNLTDKWVVTCAAASEFLMIRNNADGDGEILGGTGLANPALQNVLDSTQSETGTYLTPDCLTAYWASTRDGGNDLWTSHRTAIDVAWETPTKVATFGTANNEQDPWMSADGRTFMFAKDGSGSIDLWIVTR